MLWIAAFNTSFIFGYLSLDLFFFPSPGTRSVYSATSKLKVPAEKVQARVSSVHAAEAEKAGGSGPPALLDAINKNSLVLFLLVRCRSL